MQTSPVHLQCFLPSPASVMHIVCLIYNDVSECEDVEWMQFFDFARNFVHISVHAHLAAQFGLKGGIV